ncbi:MAG: formyltetrahydrofolate deformylase [Betaproteobacteria bacterium]|nr:formyltetrahydrofolate deformylase [Betaproteobacteria bacterium]
MTYSTHNPRSYTLRVTCPAATGLVSMITSHLAESGCYISELSQYDDEETKRFFMRCVFLAPADNLPAGNLLGESFSAAAKARSMDWAVRSNAKPYRVLLMVSKFDHCLRDLLYRWEKGELPMDVVGIASNHEAMASVAQRYGIPYHHIPVTAQTKPAAEQALRSLVAELKVDLVVLARYMQILSDELSRDLAGHCINIHHSFLPSFKGGSPYTQAHQRGVKLVGATAHYVTGDLDEGPIIEQDVRRIDHRYAPAEIVSLGRDIEAVVLARALKLHLEDRVFIDGNKTIVFD